MVFICYLLSIFLILVCTCSSTCDPILSDEQDTNKNENTEKEQQKIDKDTCVININDSNYNNERKPLLIMPVALYSINK